MMQVKEAVETISGFGKRSCFQLDSGQRLILYSAITFWLVAFVLSQQRDYRDSWILEDIFWPFIAFIAIFIWLLVTEDDNRVVTILCAITFTVLGLIPALKYPQPYGVAVDSAMHYQITRSLTITGRVLSPHIYETNASMHAWLASLALSGGFSAADAIKFGLPLASGVTPLLVYWLCQRVSLPADLTKYTLGLTCLAAFPYFHPNGTGFTLMTWLFIIAVLLVREYFTPPGRLKFLYTALILFGIGQLVVWHSTTPMLLPLMLIGVSLTPLVVWLLARTSGSLRLSAGFVRTALISGIFFLSYRLLETDRIFTYMVSDLYELLPVNEEVPGETSVPQASTSLPQQLFELTPVEVLKVTLVTHGRDFMLVGMAVLGLLLLWHYRRQWPHLLFFYGAFALIFGTAGAVMVAAVGTGTIYSRFLVIPVFISPFLGALVLWWLQERILPRICGGRRLWVRVAWLPILVLLSGIAIAAFYTYQPLVPRVKLPDAEAEYVVWFHGVNSAYQRRMLTFAHAHTDPDTNFAADYMGARQYLRYFGFEAAVRRGPYLPLFRKQPVDSSKVRLFLLHWPGPAGGLTESLEYRTRESIQQLRRTPGWGLVYDNGQSFILLVR